MENTATIVSVAGIRKEYVLGGETVAALAGVDLEIRRGEYLSIMGPSGSGKSTLFNMIGGLDRPSTGIVKINDIDINRLKPEELAWLRCHRIGYIFQTFNLIPVLTALENVTLPMCFAGLSDEDATRKGTQILEQVGLGHRLHHKPPEMSGGQQQRVAIARSLANDPVIILADEPTGNLDLKTGKEIIDLLQKLNKENGATIISATHDFKMLSVSDRIVWIRDGRIDRIESREDLKISAGSIDGH
jgi:putative ABC transport system ATP-binding protein